MQKIVTNLWFDGRVEEALELYTSLLPDSRVIRILRYNEAGMGEAGDYHDGGIRAGRAGVLHHQWRSPIPAQSGDIALRQLR